MRNEPDFHTDFMASQIPISIKFQKTEIRISLGAVLHNLLCYLKASKLNVEAYPYPTCYVLENNGLGLYVIRIKLCLKFKLDNV